MVRPIEDFAHIIQTVDILNRKAASVAELDPKCTRYLLWNVSPNNTLCCLAPYIYTWAILDDVDETGSKRRWCYGSLLEATIALADWKNNGGEAPGDFIREVKKA